MSGGGDGGYSRLKLQWRQTLPIIWKDLEDGGNQLGQSSGVQRELRGVWNLASLLLNK